MPSPRSHPGEIPTISPASELEAEIFEVWKALRPDDAFIAGVDAAAGRVFVPTEANVRRALARVDRLRRTAKEPAARKFLTALRARLLLPEPASVPEGLVEAFFMYMIKEGVDPAHMRGLATDGGRAIEASLRRYAGERWAPGMRALVVLACQGLSDVLDTVESEVREPAASEAIARLRRSLGRYRKAFDLPGFRPEGTFEETFETFLRAGCDLGRSRQYARALRELWDYRETPAQVEAAGLRMLRRELPRFKVVVADMARELGCAASAEAVGEALKAARGLGKERILPFLLGLRERAVRVAHRHLVDINPRYETLVVETPPYLANTTPSGAAFSLDSLTERSREVFLVTTDERSNRLPTPAELLNLLVHEEYGHCVHGSNAAHAHTAVPGLLGVLNGPSVCTSEGLAFQMEIDFLPILQAIAAGKTRGPDEDAFVKFFDDWGGVHRITKDYEFLTLLWRIVRFLRVVGDARINSGKQDIVEFVQWAHRTTGLEKATAYYQLFPAHQVLGPGYASTYAIIGERIAAIQKVALKRGKTLRDFNGYAASIGWPPKSVFEAKLEAWARS